MSGAAADGGRRRSLREWLANAFSLDPDHEPLTDEEIALLDRIARFIVRRHMTVPAILVLESSRPLNYVGSQTMAFFEPMVRTLFDAREYAELRRILERRQSMEVLIQRIELAEGAKAPDSADQNTQQPIEAR